MTTSIEFNDGPKTRSVGKVVAVANECFLNYRQINLRLAISFRTTLSLVLEARVYRKGNQK